MYTNPPIHSTTGIIKAVRRYGGDVRSWKLRLQVRGWDRLPASLQRQIQEHRLDILGQLSIDGCREATEEEIELLWSWLDDGVLLDLGDTIIEVTPWRRMTAAHVHKSWSVLRPWWSWMGGRHSRVEVALVVEAVQGVL